MLWDLIVKAFMHNCTEHKTLMNIFGVISYSNLDHINVWSTWSQSSPWKHMLWCCSSSSLLPQFPALCFVLFDWGLASDTHIKHVLRSAFSHRRKIVKVQHFLSQRDAERLIHTFISFKLDYCNSLLSGCPYKSLKILQLVQLLNAD